MQHVLLSPDAFVAGCDRWEDVPHCSSCVYTPRPEDVGYHLRLQCVPVAAQPSETGTADNAGRVVGLGGSGDVRVGEPLEVLSGAKKVCRASFGTCVRHWNDAEKISIASSQGGRAK
eukprot:scaffold188106_cov22-Tisochrysis_lutea.AAC.1